MARADLDRSGKALVLVGGRHPHVHDGQIGIVLRDDREQRLSVADTRDDVMPRVLEQAGESLAEQGRVLRDHDAHGITTSTRVPPPSGLVMRSSPRNAETRSWRPASPEPRRAVAPPTPSSAIVRTRLP